MFINLTPHTIRVIDMDNVVHEITPSGTVARVETVDEEGDPIVVDGAKFSVKSRTMGAVSDLPEPNGTSIFLVSSMVLDGVQGRQDVFAPDTGRTAIRDGRLVWAVVNLIECRGEVDPDPEFEGDA